MCGRYTIPFTGKDLEKRFEASRNIGYFEPTYNASPGQILPVITKNSPTTIKLMKWGFITPWEKDFTKAKFKPINARNDKLNGGFFRQAFNNSRCIIPTSGYYEWRKFIADGKEQKQPYYFRLKKEMIFGFGGIYSIHKDAEGYEHYFFCIITTPPNTLQKPIHDRMPLIIAKEKEDEWLSTNKPGKLVKPFESNKMEVWRVPLLVNSFKNDGPQLIDKIPES